MKCYCLQPIPQWIRDRHDNLHGRFATAFTAPSFSVSFLKAIFIYDLPRVLFSGFVQQNDADINQGSGLYHGSEVP
jgi:hypothetical protein